MGGQNPMNQVGGKGAPTPPDFMGIANQQTADNRPNQVTPWASSTWTRDGAGGGGGTSAPPGDMLGTLFPGGVSSGGGAGGGWTQTVGLSPELQAGSDRLTGAIANQDPNAIGHARDQSISSAYNQFASRLDPQWAQRQEAERASLANQGIDIGSEAYNTEMGNFNRARNDAYSSALNNSVEAGNRGTMAETMSQNAPYMQLQALQGLSGMPGFAQSSLLPAAMAQYQGALNSYGTQQAGKNSMMGGASNLGAAYMMAPVA